jgi:ABC-type branched-subunit amino acid transport system substrate-binding protein
LAIEANVPFITPVTGAMSLREPFHRNVFHLRASYNDETELIVKELTHLGLRKIAVFYQNDAYGKAGLDGVTLALSKRGLMPSALATVERNSSDVSAAVKTIVATQPHAVVQVSAYQSCAAFIRAARKAGYGGTFYNVSFVGAQALADELGKDGVGVVISQVIPSPYSMTNAITRDFNEAARKSKSTTRANYSSAEGFLAARMLVEGLRRSPGKPSREGLIAGLESLDQSLDGFEVALSPKDHVASKFVELSVIASDGKIRT